MNKALVAVVTVATIFAGALVPTANAEPTSHVVQTLHVNDGALTLQQRDLLNKVVAVRDHFYADENGRLAIDLSNRTLKSKYGFTDSEVDTLRHEILGIYVAKTNEQVRAELQELKQERAYREGSAVCFTHEDLVGGVGTALVAAAEAGPEALEAAFTTIATGIGGPVETLMSSILDIAGAAGLTSMALFITNAVATGRGIKNRCPV